MVATVLSSEDDVSKLACVLHIFKVYMLQGFLCVFVIKVQNNCNK